MLTFNELAAKLAELTGCSSADAENFLRELFALASEEIESEGTVDIPCLGRFALMEGNVVFKPDAELAEAVNAPFADFEPVELPDGFSLEETTEPVEEIPEPEATVEPAESSEHSENSENSENSEHLEHLEHSESPDLVEPAEISVPEPEKRGVSWWWILLTAILFLGVGYFLGHGSGVSPKEQVEEKVEPTEFLETSESIDVDTMAVIEPEPEPQPVMVLDTVAPGHFLTTMARAHYNQFEYWVYIYEANASRLGNPDRLESGTVVVIPSADSLGLKAGDPEKINEALLKAKEIYSRFN